MIATASKGVTIIKIKINKKKKKGKEDQLLLAIKRIYIYTLFFF